MGVVKLQSKLNSAVQVGQVVTLFPPPHNKQEPSPKSHYICPGNICPGTSIHIRNISAFTDPILT